MGNTLIDIVMRAATERWCVQPYCTTCGARQYRKALWDLGNDGLDNALAELEPVILVREERWQDALLVAIIDVGSISRLEAVLGSWLPRISTNIEFADFVLFKIVRRFPSGNNIRKAWIGQCITLAKEKKNLSLIESLLLTLGKKALEYPEIIDMAKGFAIESKQIRRVLRNSCGIDSCQGSLLDE